MQERTISNRARGCEEIWKFSGKYCPYCGKQSVWMHDMAVGLKNSVNYCLCVECGMSLDFAFDDHPATGIWAESLKLLREKLNGASQTQS